MHDGDSLIPDEYVDQKNGRTQVKNLPGCIMYLNGQEITVKDDQNNPIPIQRSEVTPGFISRQCSNIYSISSDIANHSNAETGTMNTLSMTLYSLIDILYWYKSFVTEYNAQQE